MESHVFVYGTLRSDALGPAKPALTRGWSLVGRGSVGGRLYHLGAYPGAVPSEEPAERVRGEVHRLPDPGHDLEDLDRYERCGPDDPGPHEFARGLVEVELEDGSAVTAWIYWYRFSPGRGRRLESGDYGERTRVAGPDPAG